MLIAARTMSTMSRQMHLEHNFLAVKQQIERTALEYRVPKQPRLVAVSKYKPKEDIQALYDLGQRHFGENYVQELVEKAKLLPQDIQWHFIGSLQSNKCKVLAPIENLYAVETLDSKSKAEKLNKFRFGRQTKLNVYVQVNTSGEEQKSGISYKNVEDILDLCTYVETQCPYLELEGLMTIGSYQASTASGKENEEFARLVQIDRQVSAALNKELELSMGMSNDYVEAIKQGSTSVRVGSSIFGARPLTNKQIQQFDAKNGVF